MLQEIRLPESAEAISVDGKCFESFLRELRAGVSEKSMLAVREKAEEIVRNAVASYCSAFGGSDVGACGAGKVSQRHIGDIPAGTNGLMYGRVQSGKTNASIASVALAAANGFRCFVVLTSDNTWLGKQTADRFRDQLSGDDAPIVRSWEQWSADPEGFARKIKPYLSDTGIVLVSTKNASNLQNLAVVLKKVGAAGVPGLILDDEADNASLNTNAAKMARGKTTTPSRIFELIGSIRKAMPNHVFVQVTATPQSLLLQGLKHPLRPAWHVLVHPGEGYVGGEEFFADLSPYKVQTGADNLAALRVGRVNPGQAWDIPPGFRQAVCCFVVGAVIRYMEFERREVLSMLVHIAHTKVSHKAVQHTLQEYLLWLDQALRGKRSETDRKRAVVHITEAYDELAKTCASVPKFDAVLEQLRSDLKNAQPEIIDADNPNRKPEYRRGINFLIGGNRLGRGVTIEGLTVTYYARDAKTKMTDTVHQHARMFGYRRNLLPITRLYSPDNVLGALKDIHESDEGTRSVIETGDVTKVHPVWLGPDLKPTRAGVFNPADVRALAPGKTMFPRAIVYKAAKARPLCAALDHMLQGFSDPDKYYEVPVDLLIKILSKMPSDPTPEHDWDDERIRLVLKAVQEAPIGLQSGILNVAMGPRRGRAEGFRVTRKADQPSGFAEGTQLKKASEDYKTFPLLMLRKQAGRKEDGWDGQPFYAPTLVLPQTKFAFLFVSQ